MKRIGLMGCGAVASFGHIPSIRRTEGLHLASLFDPDAQRLADAKAISPESETFSDVEAFFASGLDAVAIASPAPVHRENVLMAAQHGLPVLCEKPIAMNDAEAEEMIAAMERAKLPFYLGFVYRFSPVALQIKRWIDEGVIGEPRSLRMIYIWDLHGQYEPGPDGAWIVSPRYHGRMIEGGPLVDCGVHQIDLCRFWLGQEVVRYDGSGAWVLDDYEAPDHLFLNMDHEGGAHSFVEVSFTYGHTVREPAPQFSYDVIGTGGILRYDRNGYVLEARTGQEVIRAPGASEKNFDGMYHAFEEALRTGANELLATARDALIATQIAREATEQAISKRPKA